MTVSRDSLQRFLIEQEPIRGVLVHLDNTWRAVLERRQYPPALKKLLGEMLAACALLAATIKLNGSITMQLRGNGPIKLLVVECSNDLLVRAMAHWRDDFAPAPLEEMMGDGTFVITISPADGKQNYQGIVAIEGETIAQVLQNYMIQSEQLETHLWLAADDTRAAGMLVQKLPERETQDQDAWERVLHLAGTLRPHELLDLQAGQVLHRLFHEEDLRVFDSQPVAFYCGCSQEKVAGMLRMVGYDEVRSLLAEHGAVDVDCEFCNRHYHFDAVDAEQIFAAHVPPALSPTKH